MAGESSKGKAPIALDLDGHNLPPSPAPSTPRNGRKYALATELVYLESNDQYNASSVPIYQVREPPCACVKAGVYSRDMSWLTATVCYF